MSNNTKKVRCPHCRHINSVDVEGELVNNENVVIKKTGLSGDDKKYPESIVVVCSNCQETFKVKV